jgi:hypothetical protein
VDDAVASTPGGRLILTLGVDGAVVVDGVAVPTPSGTPTATIPATPTGTHTATPTVTPG